MNTRKLDDRYLNDSEFCRAVNLIKQIMEESELTPLDIRDVGYLARLMFERYNVRPIIVGKEWYQLSEEKEK